MTGELIRRKLKDGGVREHTYYRCGNNHPDDSHPVVRWREENIEQAILADFATIRLPSDEVISWFRNALSRAFDDIGQLRRQQGQLLGKRKVELSAMQDRLLNGYLAGVIEEPAFQTKSADLKRELGEVEESLERAGTYDPDAPAHALALFDFSQNLVNVWRRSNSAVKRNVLDCVSLNRSISDVTLVVEKRRPFGYLAERPFLKNGRGGRI